ncbi:hypothetical protein [Streptomyces sp. NBC_01465]|uniref:hypothetical protein n=1 Tax=Streptomyces sp. NBC_01465 TaxID=2903878 RepID=UPI002E2ED4E0|nr:hypothetical protein [Streptomyces sp. NBC_01465]
MLVLENVSEEAENDLYRELYAGLPVPMPDLDGEPWRPPYGTVAGRENGALAGWTVFFAEEPGSSTSVLQWLLLDRERQRITDGHNTTHPGTPAEIEILSALAAESAVLARKAGYAQLRWGQAEPGFAEGIATALGAQPFNDDEGYRFYRLYL